MGRRETYFSSTARASPSMPASVFDIPNVLSRSWEKLRAMVDWGRLLGFQSESGLEVVAIFKGNEDILSAGRGMREGCFESCLDCL